MVNTETLNALAQDFFEAHKDDFINDGPPALPQIYAKMSRYLLTGNKTDIKPEAERLLQAINKYIHYQLETRIQGGGQDLTPLTPPHRF